MKTIFENLIEEQVKREAWYWFKSEGAKEIEVHAPHFLRAEDEELHYNIVVVYRPAFKEPFEVALLEVVVCPAGAYIDDEKRTREMLDC